jgi:hypothetical protein
VPNWHGIRGVVHLTVTFEGLLAQSSRIHADTWEAESSRAPVRRNDGKIGRSLQPVYDNRVHPDIGPSPTLASPDQEVDDTSHRVA